MSRVLLAALLLAGCGSATPQAQAPQHAGQSAKAGAGAAPTEAARAYDTAMTAMHATMGRASADPDESFMRMMIPHHEGAIAMAQQEIHNGQNPEAKQLAQDIVDAQQVEIITMNRLLDQI